MKKISILGAGSFGVALGIMLGKMGHEVKLWTRDEKEATMINKDREQKDKLPGAKIPDGILCYTDYEQVLKDSEIVIISIPSKAVRSVSKDISKYIQKGTIIVSVAKGIEEGTLKRISQVIAEEIPQSRIAILSGPSHAEEVGFGIPTTVVVSSTDIEVANEVQDIFMNSTFRVYTNLDIIGVEVGGALKNVIAICAGISDGLKLGDNTKAALMSRGLNEITKLGEKMGANPKTFSGLSCMGDLIVTCMSMHSRNRRAGILIGEGYKVEDAIAEVKMVVEGFPNTKAGYQLGQKYNIELPIINEAYKILYEEKPAKECIMALMNRNKKEELA